jgi:hypothetical protein
VSHCTSYTLSIEDALEFGFSSAEQSTFIREFQDLILALNLATGRVCTTLENFYISPGGVNIIPPESKVTTQRIDNQIRVNIEENIVIRDEVQTTVGLSETFDCHKVIQVFGGLRSLSRYDFNSNTRVEQSNIFKALREYEYAITAYTKITKFKYLFNSLELIANRDGQKREADIFDLHVAKLSSVQQTDVELWRGLYNRTKHADRNPGDIQKYLGGLENIGIEYLLPIRRCLNEIIIRSL